MKRNEIISTIETLAMSQGFYGRLLERINGLDEEQYEELMEHLERQNFGDAVDMVMYFEC